MKAQSNLKVKPTNIKSTMKKKFKNKLQSEINQSTKQILHSENIELQYKTGNNSKNVNIQNGKHKKSIIEKQPDDIGWADETMEFPEETPLKTNKKSVKQSKTEASLTNGKGKKSQINQKIKAESNSKKVNLTNGKDKKSKVDKVQDDNDWADQTMELSKETSSKKNKANKKTVKKSETVQKSKNKSMKSYDKQKIGNKKKSKTPDQLKAHQQQIESLKEIDPEFYKFLKDNDKQLLDFNWDDTDEEDELSDKEDDEEQNSVDEKVHIPKENLEIASDESDFEDSDADDDENERDDDKDEIKKDSKTITLKLLRKWQADLQLSKIPIETIRNVTQAFSSALASVSDQASKVAIYKVDGSSAFNGVIQLCVLHLQQAIHKFLGITAETKTPIHKTKKWEKVRSCLRYYFLDLTRLIEHVSSSHILTVLLKHLHQMSTMVASFSTISKPILKRLIVLWSTSSEESVRVLSFLCILKIARNQQQSLLNHILKAMYMSYIRNSKFVSPNTLPGINFMRRSLVEMFALDLNVAYQHAFLYIRQLAIHLRNAIILKKKDSFQAVYNWQFLNSIRLWIDLLGATTNKPQLQPLIYPLVSITIGVIKLIPTAQFFPLRFHCIQSMISLARQTNTYIPILPFILDVLNSNTFNKKHTIVSMKPLQFTCIIRLNKSQMGENGFRDEVIENVCGLILEYLSYQSASIAFPDLIVPTVMALKQYLKICKNANYSRKLKQILDKIVENSKLIENERNKITFGLKDTQLIQSWENELRNKGVPLAIYYDSWLKTHQVKKKRQAANTDNINDFNLPMIKRKKPNEMKNKKSNDDDSEIELFPSDSENDEIKFDDGKDDDVDIDVKPKREKKNKKEKVKSVPEVQEEEDDDFINDEVDIVKDLDIDDW